GRVLARERFENAAQLGEGGIGCFAREGPALELQDAAIRIGGELATALDERAVERSRAQKRMGRTRGELGAERFEPPEHATHSQDRVFPLCRPAPMGGAALRLHLDPGKTLV